MQLTKEDYRKYCNHFGLEYAGKWDGNHWAQKFQGDYSLGTAEWIQYKLDSDIVAENIASFATV